MWWALSAVCRPHSIPSHLCLSTLPGSPALTRALLLLLLKGPSRIAKKNYSSVPSAWLHQKFIFLSFSWTSTPVYYSLFVLGRFPNTFPTMTIPHSPVVLHLHPWENWGIPHASLASLFPTSASCVWLHTLIASENGASFIIVRLTLPLLLTSSPDYTASALNPTSHPGPPWKKKSSFFCMIWNLPSPPPGLSWHLPAAL